MEYDVYYSTGGLNMIGGGADVWVNRWLELIPQHLKTESKLLIHRTRPPGHQPDCPMEVHWQGHDRKKFRELLKNARRINILHGYCYQPFKKHSRMLPILIRMVLMWMPLWFF